MTDGYLLSEDQVAAFRADGYIVLAGFYDHAAEVMEIQRCIYEIIGLVAFRHGIDIKRPPFCPATFDHGFMELVNINRAYGAEVYDAVKQIPAFIRLVASSCNEQIMEQLRPGGRPGIAGQGFGVRINIPGEAKFLANWHQEYPAQLRSTDGLVFWTPLLEVCSEMGPVQICRGSHVEGLLPVTTKNSRDNGRRGAYALCIENETFIVNKYEKVAPLTRPGDLIVMDFLLLHASGFNHHSRPLWSMQFRYFNYKNSDGISHAWAGGFASGVEFSDIHPEYIAAEDD